MQDEILAKIMQNRQNLSNSELRQQIIEYQEKERNERRLTVLQGYLIAVERGDELFEIVTKDNALEELVHKLGLSKSQVKSLLNLSIRRVAGLNRQKIEKEIKQLTDWLNDYAAK